jgi:hypothetical protein
MTAVMIGTSDNKFVATEFYIVFFLLRFSLMCLL